jgi:hypothetical protein
MMLPGVRQGVGDMGAESAISRLQFRHVAGPECGLRSKIAPFPGAFRPLAASVVNFPE